MLLGCANMLDLGGPLVQALGMPVVEPCEAAAVLALWRVEAQAGMTELPLVAPYACRLRFLLALTDFYAIRR